MNLYKMAAVQWTHCFDWFIRIKTSLIFSQRAPLPVSAENDQKPSQLYKGHQGQGVYPKMLLTDFDLYIKESHKSVRYTIYNSRTAVPILMIFIFFGIVSGPHNRINIKKYEKWRKKIRNKHNRFHSSLIFT